jgi:hypothetical protein
MTTQQLPLTPLISAIAVVCFGHAVTRCFTAQQLPLAQLLLLVSTTLRQGDAPGAAAVGPLPPDEDEDEAADALAA